jgi:hypothetical protein
MPTIWEPSATLEELVARMAAHGVARPDELGGCSEAEIQALEQRYSVRLPSGYRSYLTTMGHRAGRLFDGDHWVASYAEVLRRTHEERESEVWDWETKLAYPSVLAWLDDICAEAVGAVRHE